MCGSEYRECLLWSCSHRHLWATVSSFLFQHPDSWKAHTLFQDSAIFLPSHLKTKSSGSTLAIILSQVHHRWPSFNSLIISSSSVLMTSTIPYIFLFILMDWQALAFIHITKIKNLLGDYKLSITLPLRPGHGMELEIKVLGNSSIVRELQQIEMTGLHRRNSMFLKGNSFTNCLTLSLPAHGLWACVESGELWLIVIQNHSHLQICLLCQVSM